MTDKITKYTVFTPTYNRENLLPRAYACLLNQKFKNFKWLIIDDGSTDGTESMVNEWKNAGRVEITYVKKQNEGKFSAMYQAYNMCDTEYIVTLDSDDQLTDNALDDMDKAWMRLSNEGLLDKFAEIRFHTVYADSGNLVGNYVMNPEVEFIDSTWQELYLKNKITNECISCHKTAILRSIFNLNESFWLKGKFKYLGEMVFWARLGKRGKTRYFNTTARLYYTDAENSIMRNTTSLVGYYDELVTFKYFLSENMDNLFMAPKYYINYVVKYTLCCYICKIGIAETLKNSKGFTWWFLLNLPVSFAAFLYFALFKRKFWR
jgi:glycosyltransferase involved in cell wall biosynthesis